MSLALRVLGLLVFIAAVGGATYGAYQVFEPEATFTAVELTSASDGAVTVPLAGSRQVSLSVANNGDAPVEIVLRSATEGATLTQPAPVTVSPGATRQVSASLSLSDAFGLGDHELVVEATDNATGKVLASTRLIVSVFEPVAPGVTLEPMVPAVVPGGTATFLVTVENTAPTAQQLTLELVGTEGTLAPNQLTVQAGSTGLSKAVIEVPAGARGALSATVRAVVGDGEQSGEGSAEVPVVAPGQLFAEALFGSVAVVPSTEYTVPVVVVANLGERVNVTVAADGFERSTFETAPASGAVGAFVTLTAPDTLPASGTDISLTLTAGDETVDVPVRLVSAADGRVADAATNAQVNYIGRLTDGGVFDSSLIGVVLGPYPKAPFFQERLQVQPLTVELDPTRPNVIEGFFNAVTGLRSGQASTTTIPPAQAYGGERIHQNASATTIIPRESENDRFLRGFQFAELPPEFDIQNKEEGDIIEYRPVVGGVQLDLRFRVDQKTSTTVDLERVEEVGDKVTVFPSFPNMTEVVEVTDTTIRFRTTPTDALDEPFAWISNQQGAHQPGWGETATVASVNDTAIVLQHSPEPGTTYQVAGQGGPATYRVEAVGEETVQVSRENPSPLAGRTLIFDIFVVDVVDAPSTGGGITLGGDASGGGGS